MASNCDKYIIYLPIIYRQIDKRERNTLKNKIKHLKLQYKNQCGRFKGKEKNYMSVERNLTKSY